LGSEPTSDPARELADAREAIEAVDARIIDALAQRVALGRVVRAAKRRAGQPVVDPSREAAVVARAGARARAAGLPEDDVRALYWQLVAMTRRAQLE